MGRVLLAVMLVLSSAVAASAEESWIAIATGSDSHSVYAYLTRRTSKNEAETAAMDNCHAEGDRCSFLRGWNYGCIYSQTGHDERGAAYLGIGPDAASARAQCERTGASCTKKLPVFMCVLETNSAQPKVAAVPMAQAPGMNAPTENYRRPTTPPAAVTARAAEPLAGQTQGDLVRYFTWVYNFQPEPGLRIWSRDASNRWSERYPSGRIAKVFDTLKTSSNEGCNGQLVSSSSEPNFEIFIPNKGCGRMVARFRRDGGSWSNLGAMQDIQ